MVAACDQFLSMLSGPVLQLMAMSVISMSIIIAVFIMYSKSIANQKLEIWSRGELIQLFISIMFVLFFGGILLSYCSLTSNSLKIFLETPAPAGDRPDMSIFNAAESYLVLAAEYSHNVMNVERYYLGAFEMLRTRGRQQCVDEYLCLFGITATSYSPYAGHSIVSASFSVAFNTSMFAFLSALNYLLILEYTLSGMLLFFLPLGVFMRSVPFMRTFGSLLMAIAISFVFVYPLILSIFYLVPDNIMFDTINNDVFDYSTEEPSLSDGEIFEGSFEVGDDELYKKFFGDDIDYSTPLYLSGYSFVVSVFIPTFALLATIGAVSYVTRFLGEEVDLSKLLQMV